MQPQTNTRNLVLFFVLTATILMGSSALQRWLNPPHPKPSVAEKLRERHARDALALLAPPAPGWMNYSRLYRAAEEARLAGLTQAKPPEKK